MPNDKYDIQELLQRDVYVNDKKVGTIVGERHHPNEARVRSMRIQVDAGVADEFMRKPAELAPLPKELVHSIRTDGTVKLSKSMRELQRRWRDTVRIDEKLYAPDEMLDRAQMCARPGDQGHEGLVEKDRPIGRIVADEGKLFGMQSRVQRMAHITSARDGEPDLQMPVVVPRERSNAIALLQAERFQSRCQFSRGYGNFAPSRPVDLARGLAADDLCVCMIPSRMNDQIADQKIFEHHRTKHVVLLVVDPFAIVRTKTALA